MKPSTKEQVKIAVWSIIIFILIIGAMIFFNDGNDLISKNAHAIAGMLRGGAK